MWASVREFHGQGRFLLLFPFIPSQTLVFKFLWQIFACTFQPNSVATIISIIISSTLTGACYKVCFCVIMHVLLVFSHLFVQAWWHLKSVKLLKTLTCVSSCIKTWHNFGHSFGFVSFFILCSLSIEQNNLLAFFCNVI